MPSIFPGMDPFIEGADWEDFHGRFITAMADALVPNMRPDYAVRTERRVYVESTFDDPAMFRPDVAILRNPNSVTEASLEEQTSVATITPVERTLLGPVTNEEKYLVIRRLDSNEVVTVIELLSPSNKRKGSEGQQAYLAKRNEILQSRTSLVEIDLLRGGQRLPTVEPLPEGDYFVFVCRARRRLKAAVYAWPLAHRLAEIPIPLAVGDREVLLGLQEVFDGVYDRAGYDYSLDYRHPISPPLNAADSQWVASLMTSDKPEAREG
jgi:Protein of unknown function (DUF4058)